MDVPTELERMEPDASVPILDGLVCLVESALTDLDRCRPAEPSPRAVGIPAHCVWRSWCPLPPAPRADDSVMGPGDLTSLEQSCLDVYRARSCDAALGTEARLRARFAYGLVFRQCRRWGEAAAVFRSVAFDESIAMTRGGVREDAAGFYIDTLRDVARSRGADGRDCHVVMSEDLARLKAVVCPVGAGPDSATVCDSIVELPCVAVERTVELLAARGRCQEAQRAFRAAPGSEHECRGYFSARLDEMGSHFEQGLEASVEMRVLRAIESCFSRAGARQDAANESSDPAQR